MKYMFLRIRELFKQQFLNTKPSLYISFELIVIMVHFQIMVLLLMVLTLLLSLTIADQNVESRENYGVVFRKTKELYIDVDEYEESILVVPRPVIWTWKRENPLPPCDGKFEKLYLIPHLHQYCITVKPFLAKLNQTYWDMVVKLDSSQQSLADLFQFPVRESEARDKRMVPFGFVSTIQRYLFGTASLSDITNIENKLASLDGDFRKFDTVLKNLANQTVTFMNRTALGFKLIQDKFDKQERDTAKFNILISRIIRDMNTKESVENKSRLWQIYLTTYIGMIQTKIMLITEYNAQVKNFVRGFEHLQTGILSSDIISPSELKRSLNIIRDKLPREYELATHDLSFYYNNHLAYFQYTDKHLYLHLKIPLVQSNFIFDIYQIEVFPVPIDQAEGKGYSLTQLAYQYVLVDTSNMFYVLMSERDIDHCDRNVLVHCGKSFMKYRKSYLTCEWALWLNEQAEVVKHCSFITHPVKKMPEVLIPLDNSRFLVSSPEHPISIICEDGRAMEHRECALCSVILPCRCKGSVGGRLFRSLATSCLTVFKIPLNVLNIPVLDAFNITIALEGTKIHTEKFQILPVNITRKLHERAETVGDIGISLTHLAKMIKNYKPKEDLNPHWTEHPVVKYSMTLASMIGYLLTIPGMIALYRTRRAALTLIPSTAAMPVKDIIRLNPFPTQASNINTINDQNWSAFSLTEILLPCIVAILILTSLGRVIVLLKRMCHFFWEETKCTMCRLFKGLGN